MLSIADQVHYLDLDYLGAPCLIATAVLETHAGLVLIDPGPSTSLPTLTRKLSAAGYRLADLHALLLTHIHLDHAGATGSLIAQVPHVQVYVHELGARHLASPERLLASAQRIYGDAMATLWGDFLAVPTANLHRLEGGETLEIGGRALEVAYTPGHAIHHVSYLDARTGTAFIGDVGGMRISDAGFILPVTPPPDVHLPQWYESLDRVAAWRPTRLFVTHHGPSEHPSEHLHEIRMRLEAWAEHARGLMASSLSPAEQAAAFQAWGAAQIEAAVPPPFVEAYLQFGEPKGSWHGLARYWRKHERALKKTK